MKDVYYSAMIQTFEDGKSGVSMSAGGPTLEEAMQSIFTYATYYLALGKRVTVRDLRPFCKVCSGSGRVRKGIRIRRWVKCPSCKGKGEGDIIVGSFEAKLPAGVDLRIT